MDVQSQGELKDELLEFACRAIDDNAFRLRICMSVAAIAIRTISEVWTTFWQDLAGVFERGLDPNYPASTSPPLSSSGAHYRPTLSPHLYYARLAVMNVVGSLPSELERFISTPDRLAVIHDAIRCGTPHMLQMVQEVLDYEEEKPPTPTRSGHMPRSGSAPPTLFGTSGFQFGGNPNRSSTWTPKSIAVSVIGLKRTALEVLRFWVTSAALCNPSLSSTATLRQMIYERAGLLPMLFESLKRAKLSNEAGEILLALFSSRTQSESLSNPAGSANTSFGFTSASRMTQTSVQQEEPTFISEVLSQLLSLVDCYRAATEPLRNEQGMGAPSAYDWDEQFTMCRAIVLLFVGFGEANVTLIAGSLSVPLVHDYLDMLLEMTTHPILDVAELGMQFWNALEYNLFGNSDFVPLYTQLLKNVLHTAIFPSVSGDDAQALLGYESDEEDLYHWRILRESAVQTLRACYSVIGDQFLDTLQELVNSAGRNGTYDETQWRVLELAYYAATTVNLHVPKEAPVINGLFQIAFSLPIDLTQQTRTSHSSKSKTRDSSEFAPYGSSRDSFGHSDSAASSHYTSIPNSPGSTLGSVLSTPGSPRTSLWGGSEQRPISNHDKSIPPLLLISIARFVGEYRHWITQQDEPLPILETAIITALQWSTAPNSEFSFSAAIAFKEICLSSNSLLTPHLYSMCEKYATYYTHVRPEDRVVIATGLIFLLGKLESMEEMIGALQFLWSPTVGHIKQLIETPATDYSRLVEPICAELDVLVECFRCSHDWSSFRVPSTGIISVPGHPLIHALQGGDNLVWNLLESVGSLWAEDTPMPVTDRLCATYSNLMQSCEESYEPLLPVTLERVWNLFSNSGSPEALDALTTSITHFGTNHEHLYLFSKMILDVSHEVHRAGNPEILVSYFRLCSTVIATNPDIFVQSNGAEVLNSLIQVCLQATTQEDMAILFSALTVLDRLLFGRHTTEREAWKSFVDQTIDQLGLGIFEPLFKCAVHSTHRKSNLLLSTMIHHLLQSHPSTAKTALEHILSRDTLPGNLSFTPDERDRIIHIFLHLRSPILFRQFFADFADVANRRAELDVFNAYEIALAQESPTSHPAPGLGSAHDVLGGSGSSATSSGTGNAYMGTGSLLDHLNHASLAVPLGSTNLSLVDLKGELSPHHHHLLPGASTGVLPLEGHSHSINIHSLGHSRSNHHL